MPSQRQRRHRVDDRTGHPQHETVPLASCATGRGDERERDRQDSLRRSGPRVGGDVADLPGDGDLDDLLDRSDLHDLHGFVALGDVHDGVSFDEVPA
jgi:hypothetical protein